MIGHKAFMRLVFVQNLPIAPQTHKTYAPRRVKSG